MGDADFVDRFHESGRPGAYRRIVESGDVGRGDTIEVGSSPTHGLTVAELFGFQHGALRADLERVASIDAVPQGWRDWAERRLRREDRRR